jgi:hypothetical protein
VAQALGDVDGPPVDVVEDNRIPLSEGRRPDSDVDDHVEHLAARASDVLGLARRQLGEVNAAQCSGGRHRTVGLTQIESMPRERGELGIGEPFEECAA